MSTNNNTEEAVHVEANINTPTSANTSTSKPSFPYMGKFMSNEYEEMRVQLNEIVLATNVAYKYYPAENKPTSPWKKLYTSLYDPTNGLFSPFKIPCNAKPIKTMKKKLFDAIYPEMQRAGKRQKLNSY